MLKIKISNYAKDRVVVLEGDVCSSLPLNSLKKNKKDFAIGKTVSVSSNVKLNPKYYVVVQEVSDERSIS